MYNFIDFFYRSPALVIDSQSNKNSKTDEGKFEIENRRRAEKLLKKQFGLKPVDSWRKHKKALNAAKYFEELPVTEKINSNPEPKVPVESKPDPPKIIKIVKSNKKSSTISLPVTKQINNSDLPISVLNSPVPEVVKKPIASVAPYQIVLPKQSMISIVQPERIIEKLSISKSKPVQSIQNKVEKEPMTLRPVISKKSISEDDGLLTEYKYMKKKNKSERKASLPPPTPSIPPVTSITKSKTENIERCNTPEVTKQKIKEIVVLAVTDKENKEILSLKKPKADLHPEVEKKITVLKRGLEENHVNLSPTTINKHGNNFKQMLIIIYIYIEYSNIQKMFFIFYPCQIIVYSIK